LPLSVVLSDIRNTAPLDLRGRLPKRSYLIGGAGAGTICLFRYYYSHSDKSTLYELPVKIVGIIVDTLHLYSIMTTSTKETDMKIYNGWVLNIDGIEATVAGSVKIRGTQLYYLATKQGNRSIRRDELLAGMNNGSIKYVASVVA